MANAANPYCTSCTEQQIARVRALATRVDATISARFKRYVPKRKPIKVEVVDDARMRERWIAVRMEDWRRRNPPPPGGSADYTAKERAVEKMLTEMAGRPEAFAFGDTIYVAPDVDRQTLAHEETHLYAHPNATAWVGEQVDKRYASATTLNNFNESLTEYFNKQVTGGFAKPGDEYYTNPDLSKYGTGVEVLRQLRDEKLGGPVEGEAVLRAFYFGGDTAPLQRKLDQSGGTAKFFSDYEMGRLVQTERNRDSRDPLSQDPFHPNQQGYR